MNLLINDSLYDVAKCTRVGAGGEGSIYKLNAQLAAKVYFDNDVQRRKKVLALCNSYANNVFDLGAAFAFPQHPAFDGQEAFNLLVGFSMPYFSDCPPFHQIGYDLNEGQYFMQGITDTHVIRLIYKVFELAHRLHKARIILADVSPENILYDPRTDAPIFVDLDAVQVGSFGCRVHKMQYLDPLIERAGTHLDGAYHYSIESDVFALACVAYQLFVGVHPFFFYIDPPADEEQNKRKRVSILRHWTHGDSHLRSLGHQYLSVPQNKAIESRLESLKTQDVRLFDFFVSVFVNNQRESLLGSLPLTDHRNPAHNIVFDRIIAPLKELGFEDTIQELLKERKAVTSTSLPPKKPLPAATKTAPALVASVATQSKKTSYADPKELKVFLRNYGITYSELGRGL